MTQAYANGSTGRKSLQEGRKSNTGGPHGGPQDEGPCRNQLDDHHRAQPATPTFGTYFGALCNVFNVIVNAAAAERKAEIRAKRAVQEAEFILGCINGLEQPGGYLSQAEFNCLQRSERFMIDYCGGPTTGTFSDTLMVVNSPFGDVYVENAGPSLTPACTGIVIVNATCTTCRSEANLVLAIKTDPDSQTAKVDRGGFHFGEKPFGIPTTVGGKGLVAETEADAAKATATSDMDSAAGTCIAAEAAGEEPTASAKVKLKAEADAIKAIEANSVAEKAIAAATANAALKAMAVTVDDLKATATLSVKVDTTTAEAKFNDSMDSVAGKADVNATAIAAEAAGGVELT